MAGQAIPTSAIWLSSAPRRSSLAAMSTPINDWTLDLPADATLVDGYEIYVGSGQVATFAPILEVYGTFSIDTQRRLLAFSATTPR